MLLAVSCVGSRTRRKINRRLLTPRGRKEALPMKVYGQTHIGLVRETNQDALEYGTLSNGAQYAVVCDGMGGANGGNIASKIAVEVIGSRIRDGYRESQSIGSAEHLLTILPLCLPMSRRVTLTRKTATKSLNFLNSLTKNTVRHLLLSLTMILSLCRQTESLP